MFGKGTKEKSTTILDSDRSHDGSQEAIESVEGELTTARLVTTVLALVLSIFLVRTILDNIR